MPLTSRHNLHIPVFTLLAVLLAGCATTSLFRPYPSQAEPWKQGIASSDPAAVIGKLERRHGSKDGMLYLQESGRLAQLAGDYAKSREFFEQAFERYESKDAQATISFSQTTSSGSSLLTNDNAIPYSSKAYERVLAHHYQALNYLADRDVSGALVEIRRANLEQQWALQAHEKELVKAEQKASSKGINIDPGAYDNQLEAMNTAVRQVKNSFQNAATFFLSALVYENTGSLDDAWIDYRKAWEIHPGNTYVKQALARTGRQTGRLEELAEMGISPGQVVEAANLVIFLEDGFVPEKKEVSLVVPHPHLSHGQVFSVAFPYYADQWYPARPASISIDFMPAGNTEAILDVHALAAAALKEDLFRNILRQTLRMYAKEEFRRAAEDKGGAAAGIAASLYNIISERADLRSWLTLPRNIQVWSARAEPGTRSITVGGKKVAETGIAEGKTTILYITRVNSQFITQSFEL